MIEHFKTNMKQKSILKIIKSLKKLLMVKTRELNILYINYYDFHNNFVVITNITTEIS